MATVSRSPSRANEYGSIALNALVAFGAWLGFYQQVGWAAVLTATTIWINAGAIFVLLQSGKLPRTTREPPMAPWLWNLFDVLIGAELLAAQAYATAFAWIYATIGHHVLRRRGRAVAETEQ